MDFIVGIDKHKIDEEHLKVFKDYILNKLLPVLKENADIELSYINRGWHNGIEKDYLDNYPINEGFNYYLLSNRRDIVLSFRSSLLLESGNNKSKIV